MTSGTEKRPVGRRLGADTRRDQLVHAGLSLMKSTPFDQISALDVARATGVSKGLVFHYFPSQRDLHGAILRAAAAELLADIDVDHSLPPDERLGAGLDAYISYIEQQPESYRALVRGAGSDELLVGVFEETRDAIVATITAALGQQDPPPGLRIAIRGWIAMVEEAVLHWLDGTPVPRAELVEFLRRSAVTIVPEAANMSRAAPSTRS